MKGRVSHFLVYDFVSIYKSFTNVSVFIHYIYSLHNIQREKKFAHKCLVMQFLIKNKSKLLHNTKAAVYSQARVLNL